MTAHLLLEAEAAEAQGYPDNPTALPPPFARVSKSAVKALAGPVISSRPEHSLFLVFRPDGLAAPPP